MKILQVALLMCVLYPALPARAQQAPICEAALNAINEDMRSIAQEQWVSQGDNSAPRATNRELRKAVVVQKAQLNLALMRDAKCAMPVTPYDEMAYFTLAKKACDALKPEVGKPYVPEEVKRDQTDCQTKALFSPINLFK